ncbi:MAG: excinuclease ABC subunit C [Omnitrophica WOR_2 bacterium RIFCSPHIGHO2_01_FULL_48_9]|nr:MAG: excinuclease ABC subunit C [Omnitrophica WOR_2 bacterium RIFCSPHIGHO2_02_FULL_48_11]OGX31387.1 MAG: excinuclease ABC subunit C [Omnitrophica WOR_2 bacterium RIFCSPHIGHO2_01_FULL_48_9]
MYYVYRLESLKFPDQKYTGVTVDIVQRLESHNNGQVSHTSKYKPWKLVNYFAFSDQNRARAFEKYLKSGSGRAFAKRHL